MDFKEKKAIYLQIAEHLADQILLGSYNEGEKVRSVREMAVHAEVNPNTVMRAYEYLQRNEIIDTQRGKGYFVREGAKKQILSLKKEAFVKDELPYFFKNIYLLELDFEELKAQYKTFIDHYNTKNENK